MHRAAQTLALAFALSLPATTLAVMPITPVPLTGKLLGDARSPQPTRDEWSTQQRHVKLTRSSKAASRCLASVVREWLRLRCSGGVASAVTLLGGERDGVLFWIDPPPDKATNIPGDAEIIFPVRRGDRRLIQVWTLGPGYDGPLTVVPSFVVQEHWVDGAPDPTVIAR